VDFSAACAGRVSGSISVAQASTAQLNAVTRMKIASQPKAVSRMPPTSGLSIGITTTAEVTRPSTEAARSRS
jgi:hypothetical protein